MDAVLTELARRPRKSVRELAEVRGLNPRQIEKFGAGILDAMLRGARNTPPPVKRGTPLPRGLEPTVDFLSLCLRALSVEQAISTGILANRNDLTLLTAFGEGAHTPLLRGWRRQAAGTALLAALEGEVVARIVRRTRAVHLEWERRDSGNADAGISPVTLPDSEPASESQPDQGTSDPDTFV
jgi:ribonuclease D